MLQINKPMLNFLPQKNKNSIIFEYILRINIFLFIFLFIACLFLISLFLPSYFFVAEKNNKIDFQLQSIKQKNLSKGDDPIVFIKNINRLSLVLSEDKGSNIKNSEIINKIISLKNNDIKILSININYDNSGGRTISITGTSKVRDSLSAYDKEIKIDGFFKSSTFPVSDFIKGSNSDFTATLTI